MSDPPGDVPVKGDGSAKRYLTQVFSLRAAGYLWASPNTLIALAIGLILGGRFRLVEGVVEIEGKNVARVLHRLPNPAAAMTVGHVVFGQNKNLLELTRRHERVHVGQYARWGAFFLPAYLSASAFLYVVGRDGYRENPFEVEAFAVDSLNQVR